MASQQQDVTQAPPLCGGSAIQPVFQSANSAPVQATGSYLVRQERNSVQGSAEAQAATASASSSSTREVTIHSRRSGWSGRTCLSQASWAWLSCTCCVIQMICSTSLPGTEGRLAGLWLPASSFQWVSHWPTSRHPETSLVSQD